MIKQLNVLIATLSVFAQNQRGYHWNIVGKDFFDLHEYSEGLYDYAQEAVDMLAERVRQLQEVPVHSFEQFLEVSSIASSTNMQEADAIMQVSAKELAELQKQLKIGIEQADEADDDGTEDMLIEVLRAIDKKAWMAQSWLA